MQSVRLERFTTYYLYHTSFGHELDEYKYTRILIQIRIVQTSIHNNNTVYEYPSNDFRTSCIMRDQNITILNYSTYMNGN